MTGDDDFYDALSDAFAGPRRPVDALAQLPLDFQAFYIGHIKLYLDYAEAQLGDARSAIELVHQVFSEIQDAWQALMGEGNFEKAAWAILRQAIGLQLKAEDRRPSFIADGAVARALRASQDQFKIMESSRGLFTAIADLPPKQFDVIVLRHVLGYPTSRIAWFMGLSESVVDYHGRNAKERLRVQLGIPGTPPRSPSGKERNKK
ncbi:sigma-70 family RNA polymerase sigma factor (plasmid) [Streptomyces sp. QH1-20]|uniref:sigma-70 family RNA polymerase sigma factor n=1 Tax=Streptomyces sp. QH1-20 TaxID=3240934 RepID=UPI0035176F24